MEFTFSIYITDDYIYEGEEYLIIAVVEPQGFEYVNVTIIIEDNEGEMNSYLNYTHCMCMYQYTLLLHECTLCMHAIRVSLLSYSTLCMCVCVCVCVCVYVC